MAKKPAPLFVVGGLEFTSVGVSPAGNSYTLKFKRKADKKSFQITINNWSLEMWEADGVSRVPLDPDSLAKQKIVEAVYYGICRQFNLNPTIALMNRTLAQLTSELKKMCGEDFFDPDRILQQIREMRASGRLQANRAKADKRKYARKVKSVLTLCFEAGLTREELQQMVDQAMVEVTVRG